MCGRYTNTRGPEEIGRHFGVNVPSEAGTCRFNLAPPEEVLAIVAPHRTPEARILRWGLVPPWAKELETAHKMINARMETVTDRPAYRGLIPQASRRALMTADGYFEWLKPERYGERRQPFYFQVDSGEPFAFAALWTPAKIGKDWVHSCSLLTCDPTPNRVASAIHNRMPVILADRDTQQAWLDRSIGAAEALALCGPLPAERLSARPANPTMNKPGVPEGPELLIAPAMSPRRSPATATAEHWR